MSVNSSMSRAVTARERRATWPSAGIPFGHISLFAPMRLCPRTKG